MAGGAEREVPAPQTAAPEQRPEPVPTGSPAAAGPRAPQVPLTADHVLSMQRTAGNRRTTRLLQARQDR
jgi:hypothetical protein